MNNILLLSTIVLFSLNLHAEPRAEVTKSFQTLQTFKHITAPLQKEDSKVRTRVNYYVSQEARKSSEEACKSVEETCKSSQEACKSAQEACESAQEVSSEFLVETIEQLLLQADDLPKASAEAAKKEFLRTDLESYYQELAKSWLGKKPLDANKYFEGVFNPLTDAEIDSIQSSVTSHLNKVAEAYNQKMEKFIGTIAAYKTFLSENPDMAEQIAYEINRGNYRTMLFERESAESMKIMPTLRELIIMDMEATLSISYAKKVQVPTGSEHYEAFLPELPESANQ